MIATGSLMLVGSVLSACCVRSESFPLIYQMILYRAVIGIGIGGEYPLSASMGTDAIPPCFRGQIIAGVFAMQGLGMLFANLLGIMVIESGGSLDFSWRFLLAFTVIPVSIALYFRSRRKSSELPPPRPSLAEISPFKRTLVGTSFAWFFSDISFYGTGQFRHQVSHYLYPSNDTVVFTAVFGFVIAAIALPGYILCIIFIERVGRWNLQFFGFISVAIAYCAFALSVQFAAPPGLGLFLFGLTFLFINFGPNPLVYIIPSEVFPHRIRSTCNGISAAFGKLGATLGGAGFPPLLDAINLFGIMYLCGAVALCGALSTWIFISKTRVSAAAIMNSN